MSRADDEQAGRDRANSLSADDNYGFTRLTDSQVQAGINRTRTRLRYVETDEAVFSAARDNQRFENEAARRARRRRRTR